MYQRFRNNTKTAKIIVGAGLAPALDYVHAHKERATARIAPTFTYIEKIHIKKT